MKLLTSATRIVLMLVVFTACLMAVYQIPVSENFQSLATVIVSFFFGAKAGEKLSQPQAPALG